MAGGAGSRSSLPTRLVHASPGPGVDLLADVCRQIGEELGMAGVILEPAAGPAYRWPTSPARAGRISLRRFAIMLGSEQVGVLSLDAGGLGWISGRRAELVGQVVGVLGPLLHEARLRRELDLSIEAAREHAERIAASRRQAFAERDRERRELERDLHDGAQHHLVALRMVVGLLELQQSNADLPGMVATQARLHSGLEQTEQTLLGTAAGICPPVLVADGLVAALTAEQVSVQAAPMTVRRFPLALETAVYFTCLEAVNNARKHAPGAQVSVLLSESPQGLAFAVTDDGPGLEQLEPLDSFGLGNMRERIVAVGGRLELRTAAGAGTTVEGFIPI